VDDEGNNEENVEMREEGEVSTEDLEGLVSFTCDMCDKVFKRKEHLLQHKKSHSGLKPFICGYCGKSFSRKEHLIRHKVCYFISSGLCFGEVCAWPHMLLTEQKFEPGKN